ncbi:FAD-dependent oxidoreductase [Paenibacillus apiarius]|uniref:FAD-dependent oxidoreductase n=2 Tax=Paenibacillus apiarius TaxID=46240 RepID=A0ABT4DY92_9BACL|nr:FAD-dependent oxidoreductase [Paenibacillus apiarius]MCY9517829.1 FAD-dependent oxidoreductase [Paenibacillus apiarius]MCY9522317.1 FAD-dependent oxidoreductase [Paenibacillus apiarius]MCY9555096.1 FAD-dependent oxidoreductase [Paenibacillus apiarius]MCY9558214.1 FAD-dependent oxidoreductase [Paenibacillus apiarius]MCY9684614.1 FAD-dependent oxidoreductase [Paenibacillus apiarius]
MACAMREEIGRLGIQPGEVKVCLLNAHQRLFSEGPPKMGRKLDQPWQNAASPFYMERRALQERDGKLTLSGRRIIPVGLCVWTLGLLPNPMLRSMGLPVSEKGQVVVDASYRVKHLQGVYSIGDCARIVAPVSGQGDRMTCKEAAAQAARLGSIILADVNGGLSGESYEAKNGGWTSSWRASSAGKTGNSLGT